MAEEPEVQALNASESPPDENLDNLISPTDTGQETDEDATESDDGDTVEGAELDEDDHESPDERGPVPYNRFKSVNEEKKRLAQALETAGYRIDPNTGDPVAIGDGWDSEQDDVIPAAQLGQTMTERADDPNQWSTGEWHDYARERGYDPQSFDDNFWQLVGQQAVGEAAQSVARNQQTAHNEQQARSYIDTTLAGANADPYLSLSPDAATDLVTVIKQARSNGVPYSQIARDMPYLQAKAIVEHLDEIIESAGGKVAKATVERRQRLTAQSPRASTSPAQQNPKLTHEAITYAQQTGIPADRIAAELQRIRGEK